MNEEQDDVEGGEPLDSPSDLVTLEIELDSIRSKMRRWCSVQYGEVFQALLHLKVIQGYVESLLRYGITVSSTSSANERPSNFLMAFLRLEPKNHGKMRTILEKMSHQRGIPASSMVSMIHQPEEEEDDDDEEYKPYCLFEFNI
mmetsp:Transcript_54281/g.69789  ORF Transcript_54281/g.69789 Transcript_54281/m.69789 type:complete len:144 (+) Transcript_54281:814-1245(+)